MNNNAKSRHFLVVKAAPYAWPFDGAWSSSDTALLLLGFQKQAVALFDAEEAVLRAAEVLGHCRQANLPIIFSRHGFDSQASAIAQRRNRLAGDIPMRGSEAWQLVLSASDKDGDTIVDHCGDNAFYLTGLADMFRSRNIRNLLVAGIPTDGILHATMRSANDCGFECLAISDACRGTTAARHEAQLTITTFGNGLFGTVAPAERVIAALSANDKGLLP
jgi:nicotinamidase-related amidase